MAADFIFMLTHDDRTVADAQDRVVEALAAGVRHIGFKDIGLPLFALQDLAATIKGAGAQLYLEVVSLDSDSERKSAVAAVELGVDVLMGGTRPDIVLPILSGRAISYLPFPGRVVGHPSRLEGSIEEIASSAGAMTTLDGVDGVDLLAYRFTGDVPALVRAVCAAVGNKRVVVAGSIDCAERIQAVIESGAGGFTVGTAALDGRFPVGAGLVDQLSYIRQIAETREDVWTR